VIVNRGQTDCDDDLGGETVLDDLFSGVESPAEIYALCVAADEVSQALNHWVKAHWQTDVIYLKTEKKYKNIVNAYDDPTQHGADRWAAVVAACQSFPGTAICVISAGTAMTFDLIDKNAQHLGGYILPSFYTMHKALLADTANVNSTYSPQWQQNIPINTSDAVNQGLHKFIQSGIRDLCRLAEDTMGKPVQIVLTGGFAETILAYPAMPLMCHKPDLVMQGLYDIMQQQQADTVSSEAASLEK
jgi:type III pantothenate kinase